MTTASHDHAEVLALLRDLLPVLVPSATLDQDAEEVLLPVSGDRARISTRSLVDECAGKPQQMWPQLVETWLREVSQRAAALAGEQAGMDTSRLRLQAVPRGDTLPGGVSVGFGSQFDLLVVEDQDGWARRLQQVDLDAVGITADDAARVALDQTISQVLAGLDVRDHALPEGVSAVRMASADGVPYVSAGITSIAQLAGAELPSGALVGVPRHSALLMVRVESRRTLDDLVVFSRLVGSMFDAATDRCARGVYWFLGGQFHPVSVVEVAGAAPQISLPPELREVVAALPG